MKNWQLAIVVVIFALAVAAVPQEIKHAPTLQSCVADLNLWTSQIPGFPESNLDQVRSGTRPVTMQEIDGRISSLGECMNAYPVVGRSVGGNMSAAMGLLSCYDVEKESRYVDFLHRHGLLDKFKEEDAAGQR
jgi:hypothetical protein